MNTLANMAQSRWYWLALLALGFSLEATALYFQYVMDYGPCVLCIHVRILVLGLMLVMLLALAVHRTQAGGLVAHLLSTMLLAGLAQRAWLLLGIERGFVEGECSFDLGLPRWLPLDQWFPAMFKVWEACGYTPYVLFQVSMAESLLVIFGLLFLVSAVLSAICIREQYLKVKT